MRNARELTRYASLRFIREKCQAAHNQIHQSVQERASRITLWCVLCSQKLQPPACDSELNVS